MSSTTNFVITIFVCAGSEFKTNTRFCRIQFPARQPARPLTIKAVVGPHYGQADLLENVCARPKVEVDFTATQLPNFRGAETPDQALPFELPNLPLLTA
jgi:hypothetical protein